MIVPSLNSVVPVALVPEVTWMSNSPLGANVIVAESALTSAAWPFTVIAPRCEMLGATSAMNEPSAGALICEPASVLTCRPAADAWN